MSVETYYKAVRHDGTDFYSGRVLWDEIVRHPNPGSLGGEDAEGYLSVSVSPTDCTGMEWPCRLLVVEPVEGIPVWEPTPSLPSKRASHAWRVVRELPAHEALGTNGAEVAAFLALLPTLTRTQWDAVRSAAFYAVGDAAGSAAVDAAWIATWNAAWNATWNTTWDAARDAARDAAWNATWNAARDAAWDAVLALLVRDLITTKQFDILTATMRAAGIDFDALTGTDRRQQTKTGATPGMSGEDF